MFHKNITFRRRMRIKAINRKLNIHEHQMYQFSEITPVVRGRLNKGKIHCSCPMCSAKSGKAWGVSNNSIHNYKASDQRKFISLTQDLEDYLAG